MVSEEQIRERVEQEMRRELTHSERRTAYETDPEWAALEAQIGPLLLQQSVIEERIRQTLCERYGGHVLDRSLWPKRCARCHQVIENT